MTAPPLAEDPAGVDTLLVWDAPNLDMSLTQILGRQPMPTERPRFDAIGRWLLRRSATPDGAEACLFTNVPEGGAARMSGWVKTLRSYGYAVFAKPKTADSDVDEDMLAHIDRRVGEGLRQLVVASGDGRNFKQPLEALAGGGMSVTVLGYAEESSYALSSALLDFVDLEDVDEAFLAPLPRTRLDALPVGGAWLPPLTPLRRLLSA